MPLPSARLVVTHLVAALSAVRRAVLNFPWESAGDRMLRLL